MKRLQLLLLLALGLTVNGMEKQLALEHLQLWQTLPSELKAKILSFLSSANSVTELISKLKPIMLTNKEHYDLAQYLIHNFAEKYVKEHPGKAMDEFFEAVNKNKTSVVKALIGAGITMGSTVLHFVVGAYREENPEDHEMIKLLIGAHADINAQDKWGATPLMWAASAHRIQAVKSLLEFGADMNLTDIVGETALDMAQRTQRKSPSPAGPAIVKLLKEAQSRLSK